MSAVDAIVNDRIQNHDIILDRYIRRKSLGLNPEGVATKDFSMRGKYHIVGLPDAQLDHGAVNRQTMNTKIQSEIEINDQLESLKYLRLDGEKQMESVLLFHRCDQLAWRCIRLQMKTKGRQLQVAFKTR